MAKIETKNKQNPKLVQTTLKDGRASLALEYYLGRSESPVLDDEGNQVFYTSGAMSGKPKYKVKHNRKRENLNLYIWIHPRSPQERTQNRNTLALAEKIRFERREISFRLGVYCFQLFQSVRTYFVKFHIASVNLIQKRPDWHRGVKKTRYHPNWVLLCT